MNKASVCREALHVYASCQLSVDDIEQFPKKEWESRGEGRVSQELHLKTASPFV